MKPTGPTNPEAIRVVIDLEKASKKNKVKIWKTVADRISKSRRRRAEVNVSKLDKYCKKNESVVVPGKLLASGEITKPVTVASFVASPKAIDKVKAAGGKYMTLDEMIKQNPKGKKVRIMA